MIGDSNGEANFLHKLLLNARKVSRVRKAFMNNSSANITLSKTQLSTIRRISKRNSSIITKN